MITVTDSAVGDLDQKQQTIEKLLGALDDKLADLAEQASKGNMDETEFNNADHIAKVLSEMIDDALLRIDALLGEPL